MDIFSLLARNANKFPEQEALVCGERRRSWSQLYQRVEALAGAMSYRGIEKGDKVALLLDNSDYFIEIHFAVARLGAIGVPLNYRLAGDELAYILNNSDSKMLFYGSTFEKAVEDIRTRIPKIESSIQVGNEGALYDQMLAEGRISPPVLVEGTDPNLVLYTSGTTGRPKGAVLTHDNSIWNALNMVIDARIEHEDRGIVIPPLYHSAAINCWMLPHVFVGAALVIENTFNPVELPKRLVEECITSMFLVPAMYNFLLQVPGIETYDLDFIRLLGSGASIMPVELKQKVHKLFPNAEIIDVYGLTEAGPGVTILKAKDAFRKEGSVGQALSTLEVRVVDTNGKEVGSGEVGEIIVRGPTIMKEYYQLPEATATALREGWLYTGDLARMDEEGFLYVVDRKKDMIISGGENIYPAEVEAVLYQHAKILDAAVIGYPDAQWGESICAIIVVRPGETLTPEEVVEFTKGKFAGYKKPRQVVFVEALPRNPSGKVLKTVLRQKYGNMSPGHSLPNESNSFRPQEESQGSKAK